jgi:hypothetical protein
MSRSVSSSADDAPADRDDPDAAAAAAKEKQALQAEVHRITLQQEKDENFAFRTISKAVTQLPETMLSRMCQLMQRGTSAGQNIPRFTEPELEKIFCTAFNDYMAAASAAASPKGSSKVPLNSPAAKAMAQNAFSHSPIGSHSRAASVASAALVAQMHKAQHPAVAMHIKLLLRDWQKIRSRFRYDASDTALFGGKSPPTSPAARRPAPAPTSPSTSIRSILSALSDSEELQFGDEAAFHRSACIRELSLHNSMLCVLEEMAFEASENARLLDCVDAQQKREKEDALMHQLQDEAERHVPPTDLELVVNSLGLADDDREAALERAIELFCEASADVVLERKVAAEAAGDHRERAKHEALYEALINSEPIKIETSVHPADREMLAHLQLGKNSLQQCVLEYAFSNRTMLDVFRDEVAAQQNRVIAVRRSLHSEQIARREADRWAQARANLDAAARNQRRSIGTLLRRQMSPTATPTNRELQRARDGERPVASPMDWNLRRAATLSQRSLSPPASSAASPTNHNSSSSALSSPTGARSSSPTFGAIVPSYQRTLSPQSAKRSLNLSNGQGFPSFTSVTPGSGAVSPKRASGTLMQ